MRFRKSDVRQCLLIKHAGSAAIVSETRVKRPLARVILKLGRAESSACTRILIVMLTAGMLKLNKCGKKAEPLLTRIGIEG